MRDLLPHKTTKTETAHLSRFGTPEVTLMYNPTSGGALQSGGIVLPGGRNQHLVWLEDATTFLKAETGVAPNLIATETPEEALATLRDLVQRSAPLVIAAGGDGTLRTAANVLAGTDTALGILPRGTVNVFARELSIPLDDLTAALQLALHGRTRRVDVGCIWVPNREEGQLFLLMASLGVDALAVDNVNPDVKEFVGASAYVLAGLSTLANFVPPTITLRVHGSDVARGVPIVRSSEAFAVLIANTTLYGGDFRAAPDALLDDGLFDVFVFDAVPGLPAPLQRANFAKQFGLAALGQHLGDPHVHYITASRLEVTCVPATSLQADGDSFGTQPSFFVEVMPQSLAVRC